MIDYNDIPGAPKIPEEWANLPDDETTPCGMPLHLVHPELYDKNNKLRPEAEARLNRIAREIGEG